jgi:hypothetical protein
MRPDGIWGLISRSGGQRGDRDYSTVTDLAKLRG